ncbi:HP1 family phage holin [Bordetella bronchiseptica]|uniref:Holin n=2 Tax=Bordetella bronchiseptica TaxID=518 RepID=A0A0C6NZF2_BORBO|nr:holin [Bordetella bronchiseptica]SHS99990.1 Uncharacterised protein [Mycobacteroides abscessus subsp. abscessus]WLS60441.1 holin [Bordetella bronchiseptica]WLS61534.1 holin [Bordetella bronchiseptica]WLS65275.1 holin [Bordetella bronchiseptica]CCJ51985.1 phage-related conserved hypothetical protein [Bordetella bronchiseptica 253]
MVDQPITQKVVPSAAMYVGSTSAMFGGFTANELAALGGLALAVLGFVANFWFKWQHLKIARQAASEANNVKARQGSDDGDEATY